MLFPRPEPTGTRPVTLIQALLPTSPLGDLREEILHRLTQIKLGQQLEADVQAKLSDGSFLVKIADATTRMNLPSSTNIGDKVALTLIGKEPRPTFLLNSDAMLPHEISSTTSLSTTAKLIDTLLHNALPGQQVEPAVIGKAPIIHQAGLPAPQLANALEQTLTKTGVFYESHLNEWVNGQRTLTDIKQEPQAQQTSQINVVMDTKPLTSQAETANQTLNQLVSQQLQTLEQNRIIWQGEVWPGQTMRWEVSEDTSESVSEQIQASWRSEVRFEMPQLGVITATLRLTGEHLTLQIHTDTALAAAQLQAQGNELGDALAAAGIPLDGLRVKINE